MDRKATATFEENKQFLLHSYTSKENFFDKYEKFYCGKVKSNELYLQILTDLERNIFIGNFPNFKHLIKLICYIGSVENRETLRNYCANTASPFKSTNLVILACKHDRAEILNYIFDNNEVLDYLTVENALTPNGEDETHHNAFYYAIRSGNVELLDTLINKWPGNYFINNLEDLDDILSRAYEQLSLTNLPLSNAMHIFIDNKLINLRFFAEDGEQLPNAKPSLHDIKQRVKLVLKNIRLLNSNVKPDLDDKLLYTAKFVAQNIHILKRQLKSTYDRLPWEEIEFCLVTLISSKTNCQAGNAIYNAIITLDKIRKYLECFSNILEQTQLSKVYVNNKLPKLKRKKVVTAIMKNNPGFKELYDDYDLVKDIYSLEKITSCIRLALSVDPKGEESRLIIARALQITGENLKCTLECPSISESIQEVLLVESTGEVVKSFRNVLSHFNSLQTRIEIEESQDFSYFLNVQNDLSKIRVEVSSLCEKKKVNAIRTLTKQIVECEDSKTAKIIANIIMSIMLDCQEISLRNTNNPSEFIKIKNLISKLDEQIDDKTPRELMLIDKIKKIINLEETKLTSTQANGEGEINNIGSIVDYARQISNGKCSKSLKYTNTIEDTKPKIQFEYLKDIPHLIYELHDSTQSRTDSIRFDKIKHLINSISYSIRREIGGIKGIETLKNRINEESIVAEAKVKDIKAAQKCLRKRLGTLKNVLSTNNLLDDSNLSEKFAHYKINTKLQLIVEMLVLDIMEILKHLGCLGNNFLFLDKYSPLLLGRSLRNHLAHDNCLNYVLQFDTPVMVLSNAWMLIKEEKNLTNNIIGRPIMEDLSYLNKHHLKNITLLSNQAEMFEAARNGHIDMVIFYISKGADVTARDINQWNALHFAAAGGSLEATKLFIDYSLDINGRDVNNQKPLHIAAFYGRKNIIEFYIKVKGLPVNDTGSNKQTPLHIAAENGHKDVVARLLEYKSDVEAKDMHNLIPLHYAARDGHLDIVKFFMLYNKATVNAIGIDYWTPLHFASCNGNLDVVITLLARKANVHAKTIGGDTPLSCAAQQGHIEILKTLFAHGADVNIQTVDGLTPLYSAVWRGATDVVTELLAMKAKVDIKNNNWKALHAAARNGYVDIVKILLEHGSSVDSLGDNNVTALQLAAENGDLDVVQLLLNNKADINTPNKKGCTALHFAVKGGHYDVAKTLLISGANPKKKTLESTTPLHIALIYGHLELVQLLLESGAQINVKNKDGYSPLCLAVAYGHDKVVQNLIEQGANVNDPDRNKWMPLHYAAHENRSKIVDILLQNGANAKAKTVEHVTPLYIAASNGCLDTVKALLKQTDVNVKSNVGTPLHAAAIRGSLEIVRFLLTNGANVNAKDNTDRTPLRVAVQNGCLDIVELLIENAANINAVDKDECTPLMLAVILGDIKIVEVLLSKGANINMLSGDNMTALHWAADRGHAHIVEVLINNGAAVNTVSNNGMTPLHLAVFGNHTKVVKVLLDRGAENSEHSGLLHKAAASGNVEIIEIMLSNNKNIVNSKDKIGCTALHAAAIGNKICCISTLVKYKANVNAKDIQGFTPLLLAARIGHTNVVEALLAEGAKVNVYQNLDINFPGIDISGPVQALYYAVVNGHIEIVEILLKNGASTDTKYDVFNILHIAVITGRADIVETLLRKGANVNVAVDNGKTSLYLAVEKNYENIVRILLHYKANPNIVVSGGGTPLHVATVLRLENIMEILLSKGAQIDDVDNEFCTPLHRAVQLNFEKIVKFLLLKGANVDSAYNGRTALHVCASEGNEKLIEILLQNEANVNAAQNELRATPLHLACARGHLKSIVSLLDAPNIEINARDSINRTPLYFAIFTGNKEIIKILIKNGAYFDAVSDDQLTPLNVAFYKGHIEIFQMLNLIESLFDYVQANNYSGVENCIKQKVLVNSSSTRFETPLFSASKKGYANIICLLLENEANVNAITSKGLTALHVAANIESVKALLKFGATFNIANSKGKTPLDLCTDKPIASLLQLTKETFECAKNDNAAVIEKLKSVKHDELLAIANAKNIQSYTALQVAITNRHKNFSNQLLNILKNSNKVQLPRRNDVESQTQLESLQNNAKLHIRFSKIYLPMLRDMSVSYGSEKNPSPWKCLKEGSYFLGNAYALVKKYKEYTGGAIYDKNIELIHTTLVELEFDPIHITSEDSRFASKGQGTSYYNMLHSESKMDVRMFIKLVERDIDAPVERFLESVEQKLQVVSFLIEKLQKAIDNKNLVEVKNCLKKAAIVNSKYTDGRTPLHYAVNSGSVAITNFILKSGADIAQVTSKGNTALHIAASKGFEEIVDILLQSVESTQLNDFINAQTTDQLTTSLHVAVKNGYFEIVKSLMKSGAIFNIANKVGKIPLDLCNVKKIASLLQLTEESFDCASNGNGAIIEKLRTVKPDELLAVTGAQNIHGNTLLEVAITNQDANIYDKLLDIVNNSKYIQSPSIAESKLDYLENLKNAADLHIEVSELYLPILRNLSNSNGTEINPNPWKTLKEGSYFLENAHSLVEIYEQFIPGEIDDINMLLIKSTLVELEFDPEHISFGYTDEAYGGKDKCFVSKGQGKKYYKLLHSNLKMDVRMFIELVEGGIDAPVKRFLKSVNKKLQVASILIDKLQRAIENKNLVEVENCLKEGAIVNSKNTDGRTPLHFAVNSGNASITKVILQNGADVTLVTSKGNTALHIAASRGYLEIVNILLENVNSAKLNDFINAKTTDRLTTSLHVAAKNGFFEIVISLLKYGAIFNIANKDGKTPLDLCTDRNVRSLLNLMVESFDYANNGNSTIITKLKILNPDVFAAITNAHNIQGHTLLQVSTMNHHTNISAQLLVMLKKPR